MKKKEVDKSNQVKSKVTPKAHAIAHNESMVKPQVHAPPSPYKPSSGVIVTKCKPYREIGIIDTTIGKENPIPKMKPIEVEDMEYEEVEEVTDAKEESNEALA